MVYLKFILFIVVVSTILFFTFMGISTRFPSNEPKVATVQPECPKGLAEEAAQKDYDYNKAQAGFKALEKGPK